MQMPHWLRKVIEFSATRNTHAQRILLTSAEILLDLLERRPSSGDDNIKRIQELILPSSHGLARSEAYSPGAMEEQNYCMDII